MVEVKDVRERDVFQLDPPTVCPDGPVTDMPTNGGGGSAPLPSPPAGAADTTTLVTELDSTYVFPCSFAVGPVAADGSTCLALPLGEHDTENV